MNLKVINKKYIDDISFHRKQCSKNKALLSFKYEELNFKTNIIQIMIIILSTGITFIETMKSYYDLNSNFYNTIIIIFSTMVALIMSIFRFLKFDERRENLKKSIEDHVFIINKFRKTFNQLENANFKGNNNNNNEELMKIMNNYENEIFDNYINIRENFDTLLSFKETIYYKNKYKQLFLELERTNGEIELINEYRDKIGVVDYIYPSIFKRLFCCKKKKLKYDTFLQKTSVWKKEKETSEKEKQDLKKEIFQKGKNYYKIKMNHIVKDIPHLKDVFMKEIINLSNQMEDKLLNAKHETYLYKINNQKNNNDDNYSIYSNEYTNSEYDYDYDNDNDNDIYQQQNMRNEMFRSEACAPTERQPQMPPNNLHVQDHNIYPQAYEVEDINSINGDNNNNNNNYVERIHYF